MSAKAAQDQTRTLGSIGADEGVDGQPEVVNPDGPTESLRPAYHFTPQAGWMNDPNGLVFANGKFHLGYQFDRYDDIFKDMSWGHAVSADLVNWEERQPALCPTDDGFGLVFSGCAVVDEFNSAGFGEGAVVGFYTCSDPAQQQCMAYSLDGLESWEKYANNPVVPNLDGMPEDFRDPKVFWHSESRQWIMCLAAKDCIEFWVSSDLKQWKKESDFGSGIGAQGGAWECPDLRYMQVGKEDSWRWVLIVSLNPGGPCGGSGTQYFIGDFGRFGGSLCFRADDAATRWLDYGADNYAGVTFSNTGDRAYSIGWMSNWNYAVSAPTLPWRGTMTLVRELKLERFDGEIKLTALPAENYRALFGSTLFNASVGDNSQVIGPELAVSHVKLSIALEQGANVQFGISNALGDKVLLVYDAAEGEFSLDRAQAGDASFSDKFDCTQKAVIGSRTRLDLEIFLDRCSIECFVNAGEYSFTSLLFPSAPYDRVELTGAAASALRVTEIHPAEMHRKGPGQNGLQVEPRIANGKTESSYPCGE